MTEITYGRIIRNNKLVGYCSYIDDFGRRVEIFSEPFGELEVYVAGQKVKPAEEHIIVWTHIAELIGVFWR